jgi:hypothetical protein
MKGLFWLVVGAGIMAYLVESNYRAASQPLIPGIQPGGCVPGDPSVSWGGKTYCIPQGVITY